MILASLFYSSLYSCLTITARHKKIWKKNWISLSKTESISVIFAEFNFAILGQNGENKFYENFLALAVALYGYLTVTATHRKNQEKNDFHGANFCY